MNIAVLDLIVPDVKETRAEIRGVVDAYFLKNSVIPPISYEGLFDFADKLIKEFGWDEKYRAFVMVCCGNSIWRNIVGAVPFNRRVLLLPQCLRNSTLCKAEFDELGLLCRECGECNISYFIREAEKLGYEVLVTDGTTVTAQLIETGKIDAVIGVGCMEVLQKLFITVNKYAIPSIGIPLLTCGCKDTIADLEWIKEEIFNLQVKKDFDLLDFNQIRAKTDSAFNEQQLSNTLGYNGDKTERIALKSLLLGGHRFRPFLALLGYEAFCKQPVESIANRMAVSVECFHKASLIHDDIEDNDDTRYGVETVHAEYGTPIAINIGDLLIGEGYRLIAESELAPELIRDGLKIIARGHKALSIGQGAELIATRSGEILSRNAILTIFENKTAAAFKVSLLLGATIGGADKRSLEILDRFSHSIGIAYQIMDDLNDYQGQNGDIAIRKFSILLSLLNEKLSGEKPFVSIDTHQIMEQIKINNIQAETETLLALYINEAKKSLEEFDNLSLKLALHEIVGKIFKDYL
jgi:geranylgeranyl pyrophosphate synthase